MLRTAAKQTVRDGLKLARSKSTAPPVTPIKPKNSSGGGKLALTLGLTTAATGGVLTYAYMDPEFRKQVENKIPQSKEVFDKILGAPNTTAPIAPIEKLPALPKKVDDVLPPLAVHQPPPVEKKPAVHVDPIEIHKPLPALSTEKPSEELLKIRNKQLEDSLFAAIRSAESRVQLSTDTKIKTIEAINAHATLLKQTVDDAKNADWEKVTKALQQAEALASTDALTEADGRNYVDNLRKIINDGKADPSTATNPLLINAMETANKLNHQLDELNNLVHKARQESTILNQYKDLIDRSREQFALEMKSILPNVDLQARGKNLSEEELNALIAHAHLRVDQLRRQLAEQQLREEQNIARAIEAQRGVDEKVAEEKLMIELKRGQDQKQVDVERELLSTRSHWEEELEGRLRRAAGAHAEHLEQVIRTQRQLFEIEHNQKVEEAVLIERTHHSKAVGQALSRLEGIESALGSRVALDAENRRCKQFWIACHNLIDTIVHGIKAGESRDARRAPLKDSLEILRQVNPDDDFVSSIANVFPDQAIERGVYTEHDLKNIFNNLYKVGRRTAFIDDNGGSIAKYAWSWIRSTLSLDIPKTYSRKDSFDPVALDNMEILSRAKWYVDQGDYDNAVKVVQLLRGEPARLAEDWVKDTRAHLETRLLAELLVAHAAVTSIRSTY